MMTGEQQVVSPSALRKLFKGVVQNQGNGQDS